MNLALAAVTALVLATCPADAGAVGSDRASSSGRAGETVRLHDAAADTWSFTNVSGYVPEAEPAADLLRAQITHGRYAVGVRLVFDDLRRTGNQWYRIELHTPGATSWFVVEARKTHYSGTAYQEIEGEWVRVPGIGHRIDYATDRMTLRVPRSLLDRPPWVRVRIRFELGLPDGTYFTDNPMNTGPESAYTPRIRSPLS